MTAAANPGSLTVDQLEALLKRFRQAFDGTDNDVALETLLIFLKIAQSSEISMTELHDKFPHMSKSMLQRHVSMLKVGYNNGGKLYKGAELIEEDISAVDRRIKLLYVTLKGTRLLADLKM